jgi:hypothetical protein
MQLQTFIIRQGQSFFLQSDKRQVLKKVLLHGVTSNYFLVPFLIMSGTEVCSCGHLYYFWGKNNLRACARRYK